MISTRDALELLSSGLGWTYFLIWSVSWYPLIIHNYQRSSTVGCSFDSAVLRVIGMSAYTVFNGGLLFIPVVRAQYAQRHPASPEPPVHMSDFLYALHGTLICLLLYSQFMFPGMWGFETQLEDPDHDKKGKAQKPELSTVTSFLLCGCLGLVLLDVMAVLCSSSQELIDVLYLLSTIKVSLTAVKYTPQAWMNYRRRSTAGISIIAILMDFTGGILSLIQLLIDASLQGDWSGISGNAPKLMLGNITILYDVIFTTQYFCLYPRKARREITGQLDERDRLLV
ncbi:hypothetical protein BDW74DRAFT_146050 [Aspergillus multicolor]|uniref:putative L-cystine transporter n=1 Tax=Aspergillus multicolor TaxID=41759 RepID=UPI003CCCB344